MDDLKKMGQALLIATCALLVIAALTASLFLPGSERPRNTVEESKIIATVAPPRNSGPSVGTDAAPLVRQEKTKVIILGEKNTVVLKGAVTSESVAAVQKELLEKSAALTDEDVIYLVLDTPGGDIDEGNLLIDTVKSLPQKVKTLTLFSASMGFHIVQNLDERMIIPSGTLMSHRARASGMEGQVPGELVVRTNHLLRLLSNMENIAATRMGITLEGYRNLVHDEYWVSGFDAIQERVADTVVLPRCGKDMMGTTETTLDTPFGKVGLVFSKCPIIRGPLKIDLASLKFSSLQEKSDTEEFIHELYSSPENFVRNYILTEKYKKFLVL